MMKNSGNINVEMDFHTSSAKFWVRTIQQCLSFRRQVGFQESFVLCDAQFAVKHPDRSGYDSACCMAYSGKVHYWVGMSNFKTVVFDLDGTLIDSAPDLRAAINVSLREIDRVPLDLSTIVSFIGDGVEKLVERSLFKTGGLTEDLRRKTLERFLKTYAQNMTTLTQPYPGVIPFLEELRSTGISLGICTNKPTRPAKEICDELGLSGFFDVISGAEPDQPRKPDPSPLLRCIADLDGTAVSSLYVGDSAVDYQTALNANVPFRLFSGGYLNAELPLLAARDRFDDWTRNGILEIATPAT